MVRHSLVPAAVEHPVGSTPHYGEGAASGGPSLRRLGQVVVWLPCHRPVRQPGGGSVPAFTYLSFLIFVEGPGHRPQRDLPPWATGGTPPGLNSRLDITAMAPAVQRYFQDGLAPSTRRTYDSAMRKFSTFCEHYHVTDPFPVSEFLHCAFAA